MDLKGSPGDSCPEASLVTEGNYSLKDTAYLLLPGLVAIVVLFVAGSGSGVSAAAVEADQAAEQRVENGRAIYVNDCQPCHGSDGGGDGPAARFLETPPRDLTSGEWTSAVDGSLEEIARVIAEGVEGTEMEPFSELLTEEEILDVATYVFEVLALRDDSTV